MTSWERRIERAAELAKRVPAAAGLLRFYIAVGQASWPVALNSEQLRQLIARQGPPLLAEAARNHTEPAESFIARMLLQAEAVEAAAHCQIVGQALPPANLATRNTCPFCGERPVAAVLRPEGEGGKRYLLCSLCLTEWEFRRMLCPNCGEENHEKLPVYTTTEFPHIRVEACDSCRHYIKAIDLTVDGLAVPEVDELAAIALDLWATNHEYTKIARNILSL
jgi:formate dehydrogenase maturation protein FdhE